MKAIINGIDVFGTPEEIMQYKQLSDQTSENKIYMNVVQIDTEHATGFKEYLRLVEKQLDKTKTF